MGRLIAGDMETGSAEQAVAQTIAGRQPENAPFQRQLQLPGQQPEVMLQRRNRRQVVIDLRAGIEPGFDKFGLIQRGRRGNGATVKTAGAIDPYRLLRRPQQLRRFVFDFAQQARHGQPVGGAQPVQQRRRRAGFGALHPRERRPAKAGALRQRLQRPPLPLAQIRQPLRQPQIGRLQTVIHRSHSAAKSHTREIISN